MLSFQIESETSQATDQSNETLYRVYDLKARLKKLQYKFIENERDVEKAEMEAQNAEQITAQAEEVIPLHRKCIKSQA